MGTNERRAARRITYYCEATIEGLDVSRTDVRLSEISSTGAFVDTRMVLPAGAAARLHFKLRERSITVTVQVRYAIPSMGMGLHFTDLSPEDRQALDAFLAETTGAPGPPVAT